MAARKKAATKKRPATKRKTATKPKAPARKPRTRRLSTADAALLVGAEMGMVPLAMSAPAKPARRKATKAKGKTAKGKSLGQRIRKFVNKQLG